MPKDVAHEEKALPLRAANPSLFQQLQIELEKLHIHPYDIEAFGAKKEDGVEVILKYGESFSHVRTQYFTNTAINEKATVISQFFKETGDDCQKVLIADYYKMMKS